MEALQMQKFQLKKERLNFMEGWVTEDKAMVDNDPDEDLLPELLEVGTQDHLDHLIQSITCDKEWFCYDYVMYLYLRPNYVQNV